MSRNISIKEALGMATKTLISNKLRSSLTMLGIIIGNASVITLVGLGRGAQTLAKNQLSNLGANVLFIVPGNNDTRRRGISFPKNLVLEDDTKEFLNSGGGSEDFGTYFDQWYAREELLRNVLGYEGCIHGSGKTCPDFVVRCENCTPKQKKRRYKSL